MLYSLEIVGYSITVSVRIDNVTFTGRVHIMESVDLYEHETIYVRRQ